MPCLFLKPRALGMLGTMYGLAWCANATSDLPLPAPVADPRAHVAPVGCERPSGDAEAACAFAPMVLTAARPQGAQAYRMIADPKQPIQPVPASDAADYLKQVAGFSSIRNGGSNGDPVFRGLFGSRLKILNQGSDMPGACPARMDAPTSYIAPSTFDAIEIVKGPQTVQWGAASAATVHFIRQQPDFTQSSGMTQASVLTGSNQRVDSNLDTRLGHAQGYARLMAQSSQAGDYQDGSGQNVPAQWHKWNADLAVGYTPTQRTWLELTVGAGDGEARYAGRSMDGSQFRRESVGVRFEQQNTGSRIKKLASQINYQHADHVMDNYSLRTPGSSMSGMAMHGMPATDPAMAMALARGTLSVRVAATMALNPLELVTGLDANTSTHQGRMGGRQYASLPWQKDARFDAMGLFAEGTWKISAAQKIASGMRLDQARVTDLRPQELSFNQTRQHIVPSGFVRLEERLAGADDGWRANRYIGLGFVERMPDYWELFSAVQTGGSNAFMAMEPEKTTQLDIGIHYQAHKLSAWSSGYLGYIDDYIVMHYQPQAGHAGTRASAQQVAAIMAGAEAGLAYSLSDWLQADLNLAYARGRNQATRQPLPQIAPLDARLGLHIQQPAYTAGLLWRLVAPQHRIALNQGNIVGYDMQPASGFGVFSINAAYQLGTAFSLSAGVDNLFDKTYAEHLNKAGNASFGYASLQRINDPGRNYWARLAFNY